MPDYDFKTLSPVDFEWLSRDLLQEEHHLTLQSFTTGRDTGIDFRYSRDSMGALVVQCKHYAESGYDRLLHELTKKELPKLHKLQPKRYVLSTSVPLTPKRKNNIAATLTPYMLSTDDIYGKDDLNNLLGKFPTIERKTIKLWLFSLPVLEEILHAGIRNISRAEMEHVRENAKLYVQNESFDQAVSILDANNFCIIAGIPGIGKTILAEMLVLHYSHVGYEVVKVTHDIAEAWDLKGVDAKRLFYYDDFLGQSSLTEKLRKNEDQRIIDFIHAIRQTRIAKLIMTTREYVLQQAYREYEKLSRERFADQKCIVDLSKYTRMNRARILYNHVYFSLLPAPYRAALLSDHAYLRITNHRNYSPRIVQLLTEFDRVRNVPVPEYVLFFMKSLDNPQVIWEQAFTRHLSQAARNLLVVMASLPHECFMRDVETAFNAYNPSYARVFSVPIGPLDFRTAMKELDGDFLKYEAQELGIIVRFTNPSARDFVCQYVKSSPGELSLLLRSSVFFEQLNVLWTWQESRTFLYAQIQEDAPFLCSRARQLMTANTCRLITIRRGENERKEHWPHSLESRIALLAEIQRHTGDYLLPVLLEFIPNIKQVIEAGDYDRDGLADLVIELTAICDDASPLWIHPIIMTCIDALIQAPRWADDLRPLSRLVQKKPTLFDQATLFRFKEAVEDVAQCVLDNNSDLDSESLREEAEALESLAEVAKSDVTYAVARMRDEADERDQEFSEDDDRLEYSSSSADDKGEVSDEDIESMFSTLTVDI